MDVDLNDSISCLNNIGASNYQRYIFSYLVHLYWNKTVLNLFKAEDYCGQGKTGKECNRHCITDEMADKGECNRNLCICYNYQQNPGIF